MTTTATAHLTIGGSHESVRADAVMIHRVTADAVSVSDVPAGHWGDGFTSINVAAQDQRLHNLFVHGTPGQRATELLRIAHILAEAAEVLAAENAEMIR